MSPGPAYRLPLTLVLTVACGTLPPLRGKIDVGRESYAIFVGGSGVGGDLYAVRADGGPAYQITYTTVAELRPALSPDGAQVAFFASSACPKMPGSSSVSPGAPMERRCW